MNIATNKTTTTTKAKAKAAIAAKTAFLNSREKMALHVQFHETKLGRLADKYLARQVKNLANLISRVESIETGKAISAISVLNDFRQGKFSDTRLTENRVKSYVRNLSKAAGFDVSRKDVERDLMRQAAAIWKTGKF